MTFPYVAQQLQFVLFFSVVLMDQPLITNPSRSSLSISSGWTQDWGATNPGTEKQKQALTLLEIYSARHISTKLKFPAGRLLMECAQAAGVQYVQRKLGTWSTTCLKEHDLELRTGLTLMSLSSLGLESTRLSDITHL